MLKYKIICYNANWEYKKDITNIVRNVIDFWETINTWQWELILRLNESFITDFYNTGDIIEIFVYSDKFKEWIPRYSWAISWIRRNLTSSWEWIELKIYWIFDFLNDINITKTYTWPLNELIDELIIDSWVSNNITSKPTKILWSTKLKNLITNTSNVSYSASNDDLFTVLKKIFELAQVSFYINQKWEITEESSTKLLIASNKSWVQIQIDEHLQTTIIIKNNLIKDYSPNKPIKILNIDPRYNLDWEIIQGIDYNEINTTLLLWKALRFGV